MQTIFLIFNRIAPIILLLLIGKWLNRKAFLTPETINEMKKLVVNLALPAILFMSFLTMEIESAYFWFIPLLLLIGITLYLIGSLLHKRLSIAGEYFPFLITGFEYGMIGVGLFSAAYGVGQLGKIAIIDFGQELFVWFIYMALLTRKREGTTNLKGLFKMFLTSPVILSILSGIMLNLFGVSELLTQAVFLQGIFSTIELVGGLTIPLILIVVGYGIQLDRSEFAYSLRVILIRLGILIPLALFINHIFISGWLGLDRGFQAAFFTLMILPPPFILTLFMDQKLTEERHRIDNTLTLHTLATIAVFITYYAFNPLV
jgi:malate permease and related proteins